MGEMITEYKILVRKYEGKSLLGRPMSRREHNIKIDLNEIWCLGVDCIQLAQDSVIIRGNESSDE
jgi:hypothetical protein